MADGDLNSPQTQEHTPDPVNANLEDASKSGEDNVTAAQATTSDAGSSETKKEETPSGDNSDGPPITDLDTLQKALAAAEVRAKEAENNRQATEKKWNDLLESTKVLTERKRGLEKELRTVQNEVRALESAQKNHEAANKKHRETLQRVKDLEKEKERLVESTKDSRAKIASLDESIEALTMENERAQEEIKKLTTQLQGKEQELKDVNAKLLSAEASRLAEEKPLDKSMIGKTPTTPISLHLCRSIFPTTEDATSNDPSVFSTKRLWPNGQVITYCFVDGHVNQHTKVTKVIPEWSRYANITFKLVSDNALLVISFKNTWECWSHIGMDARTTTAKPPYTMALGPVSTESPSATRSDRALILHQFGHALGLVHEHMRPAETDAISLKQNEIFKYPSFQDSDPSLGKYFSVYASGSITNYASPDLSSVMVFSMPGELNEGNLTIEPNVSLSPLDKAFMVVNYPRARVHSQASEWTLRHALLIANVDEHTTRAITEEHDLTKRRTLFANFLSATRQQGLAEFVDPAPEIVDHLRFQPVQRALHTFFADSEKNPKAGEILADPELKEELIIVLDRLAAHRAIREVVQRGKAVHTQPEASDWTGTEPSFVCSLLNVALMLHGAAENQFPPSNRDGKDKSLKEIDAATALYTQLAQHGAFREAMERTVGKTAPLVEALPDVSGLVARLAARPAVLRAVRLALYQYVQ